MAVTQTARRRMVRAVRDALARHTWHGALWFHLDGTGGAWYPDETRVPDPKRTIVVPLRPDVDAEDLVDDAVAAWEERYGHV